MCHISKSHFPYSPIVRQGGREKKKKNSPPGGQETLFYLRGLKEKKVGDLILYVRESLAPYPTILRKHCICDLDIEMCATIKKPGNKS